MLKEKFEIDDIPAVLWGETGSKLILAVHGNMSNKEDVPIEMVAKHATEKGYQVLSFDLPEHGDRKDGQVPCKVQFCVQDLQKVMDYAGDRWSDISLFANSMGAYFSMLTYSEKPLKRVWFLSPIVDMLKIIENMMMWFQVSEERLEKEQTIATPIGQNLYWDYYTYVKEHPIVKWDIETHILYGSKDDLCDLETISGFAEKFSCDLRVIQDAEHFFHTAEQLEALDQWLQEKLD